MPEGPEVKTVARTLASQIIGKELGSLWHSPHKLRRQVDYNKLSALINKRIDAVTCYGKVLFVDVDHKPSIVAQLGMTGQLIVASCDDPIKPHTHLRWKLKNTKQEIRYVDPRRFGVIDACDERNKNEIINRLGPDPFTMSQADVEPLIKSLKRSSRPIKEALLDQSRIVGVGNIYACESLFEAGISPKRRACDISIRSYERLIACIKDVLQRAYENCGTSFSNYIDGSGAKGNNLNYLKVFQKHDQPCGKCKSWIKRIKQGGRSTFYCAQCQR